MQGVLVNKEGSLNYDNCALLSDNMFKVSIDKYYLSNS